LGEGVAIGTGRMDEWGLVAISQQFFESDFSLILFSSLTMVDAGTRL
jgi:hypothetical protein